jgi:hypothetical protein
MEKRFWIVTLVFFLAISTCFLFILTQQVTGVVASAHASDANISVGTVNYSSTSMPLNVDTQTPTSNSVTP